jgi:hypothetical protein
MFYSALAFNQYVGSWNTSLVRDMNFMFNNASAFNQNISGWVINPLISPNPPIDFATGSGITDPNYLPTWPPA